jgi:hypothetical protein
MYLNDKFVDLGLKDDEKWSSPNHRIVAVNCLIQNPRVFTKDKLQFNVGIINSIPANKIKAVNISDLIQMGCDFI